MKRFDAKLGSTAMPSIPLSPLAATSPGVTIVLIVPFVSRTFTGPGRSVKNIVPSGRNDMSHGLLSPVTKFVVVASDGEFAGGPWSGGGGGSDCGGGGGGFGGTQADKNAPTASTASPAPTLRRGPTPVPSRRVRPRKRSHSVTMSNGVHRG